MPPHDIYSFFEATSRELAAEYRRIHARSKDDPGTAGDAAEESWATILRTWLPSVFSVITKGRVIGQDGVVSRQVDVLVLDASYPPHHHHKKIYLAGGVIAAFECKLTLRRSDLKPSIEKLRSVKAIARKPSRQPGHSLASQTLTGELGAPLTCGILAHSTDLRPPTRGPLYLAISSVFDDVSQEVVSTPAEMVDVVCIADTVSLLLSKWVQTSPATLESNGVPIPESIKTAYFAHVGAVHDSALPSVIGSTVFFLLKQLARTQPFLRRLATYYLDTGLQGMGAGRIREWPLTTLSTTVLDFLRRNGCSRDYWSEWSPEI